MSGVCPLVCFAVLSQLFTFLFLSFICFEDFRDLGHYCWIIVDYYCNIYSDREFKYTNA